MIIRHLVASGCKALVIVALAAGLAALANWLRPEPLAWNWRPPEVTLPAITGLQDLEEALKDPALVLVDARDRNWYDLGHIPGAESLPVKEADARLEAWLARLPAGARVIIYCSDPLCHMAAQLGAKMAERHRRPTIFTPGFEAWADSGRPVTEGGAR